MVTTTGVEPAGPGARRGRARRIAGTAALASFLAPAVVTVAPHAGAAERTITYTVTTAGPVTGDVALLRTVAAQTLNDRRGWSLGGSILYEQVASGGAFRIVLASPSAVAAADRACSSQYSCRVGNSVYINDQNWRNGTASWTYSVPEYQQYVLMHEIGHWLGLGHATCPAGLQVAAVMQQQSIGLSGCLANVWPVGAERELVARRHGVPLHRTPVEDKYLAMGRSTSVLGPPIGWERALAAGSFQHFQRGSIYHSAATGAHEVHGAVRNRWEALSWENGPLGYPTTDELVTPDRLGRYNHFSGGGGASIYWTPATGAHAIYGDIRERWGELGWERGQLGYPSTSETPTPNGRGRFNHFSGGGASIYWTPGGGAHEIYGDIGAQWRSLGGEDGRLGFPTTGEYDVEGGRRSDFEVGTITWDRATGQTTVAYRT